MSNKNEKKSKGFLVDLSISIFLGFTAFVLISGGGFILNPKYLNWILANGGDPAQHWIGWQFFRTSPFFQFPLGANFNYGQNLSSSIIFTDSIPIFAFIFKPFSQILPFNFQYFGIWILFCFVMQAFFAIKLLALCTQDRLSQFLGACFFLISPPLLYRLNGHEALFGQWLVLAALWLYFSKTSKFIAWLLLLIFAALTHPYLLAMVYCIWIAFLFKTLLINPLINKKLLAVFFITSLILFFVLFSSGYFLLGGVGYLEYGFNRMNLISLIDPYVAWSKIFPDQKIPQGDLEGFGFLGGGIIALAVIAIILLIYFPFKFSQYLKLIMPLICTCILLYVYALSDRVAFNKIELFAYDWPPLLERIKLTFRVTGRFFWPLFYLIYLGIFYLIFTRVKVEIARALIAFFLIFQIFDSKGAMNQLAEKWNGAPTYISPLRSHLWNELAKTYDQIIYVLPSNSPKNWLPLTLYAVSNNLKINIGSFSRVNSEKLNSTRVNVISDLSDSKFDDKTLYIFNDESLWKMAAFKKGINAILGSLDGFKVLIPNIKPCNKCNFSEIISVDPLSDVPFLDASEILFSTDGNGSKFLLQGWFPQEKWGVSSNGKNASILFKINPSLGDDITLLLGAKGFVSHKNQSQKVQVLVNNQNLGEFNFKYNVSEKQKLTLKISKKIISDFNNALLLEFIIDNPKSSLELGLNGDDRKMGLGLESIFLLNYSIAKGK